MVDAAPSPRDPPVPDGAALMLRARGGDREAFAELVRRYQAPVLNLIHRQLGNRATAEELTQDVFVRVFRARATYERKAKFETWLYRITLNVCLNAADHGRRRRAVSLDQPSSNGRKEAGALQDALPDRDAEPPHASLERDELREQVRRAIDRLPAQQRAALLLSRYGELPYQEIAEALETSVEAVKSLLFRARENLRQLLAAYLREEVRDDL